MISTQALVIKLTDTEKETLDEAFDVIQEIVCHLDLNRELGLDESRYSLEVNSDSFWKLINICSGIKADEEELKQKVGEYGRRRRE